MGEHEKLYERIMLRRSDANIPFIGLCGLLRSLGFEERIKGEHHIFTKSRVEEILNLQSENGKGVTGRVSIPG